VDGWLELANGRVGVADRLGRGVARHFASTKAYSILAHCSRFAGQGLRETAAKLYPRPGLELYYADGQDPLDLVGDEVETFLACLPDVRAMEVETSLTLKGSPMPATSTSRERGGRRRGPAPTARKSSCFR
jgi:hypothetical protein